VIGFATQSVISNLISGVFLIVEKPANMAILLNYLIWDYWTLLDIGLFLVS